VKICRHCHEASKAVTVPANINAKGIWGALQKAASKPPLLSFESSIKKKALARYL
jgi:hypothetical protein